MEMAKGYRATIEVLVRADTEAEACDAICGILEGAVVDWAYLRINGKYTDPTPYDIDDHYEFDFL